MSGALLRYRILAWVTGIGLATLVFVGIPLQLAGHPGVEQVTGTAHGFLYIVYLLAVLDLAVRMRWNLIKVLIVMLSGTIPLLGLWMEHWRTPEVKARIAERNARATSVV